MADALTTFLNLTNPEVGASSDTWGTKENADRVTVDAMLSTLLTGLTLSTAGSSSTFGVAIGAASGMVLSSAYTKTTSAWAVGTGNGALDTGAIAATTWYHAWLIQRSDTGVVDILISTSVSSPTMPTNYDRKRRIGSILTDTFSQWVKFTQTADQFIWAVPVADVSALATTTPTLKTLTVPTGVKVNAFVRGSFGGSASTNAILTITSPDETSFNADTPTGNRTLICPAAGSAAAGNFSALTNTSAQIRFAASVADGSINFVTYGWTDIRGKA